MGTFLMVYQTINTILKLVAMGEKIYQIFHPDKLNLAKVVSELENAITTILHQELTQAAIEEAQGVLQAGLDFINTDYQDAVTSGESEADIWALLSTGDGSNHLTAMEDQMDTMLQYSLDDDETVQTLPIYMLLAASCIALYQARARYAPDDAQKAAEIKNVTSYAQSCSNRVAAVIGQIQPARMGDVEPVKEDDHRKEYYFRDHWMSEDKMLKASYQPGPYCQCGNSDVKSLVDSLHDMHVTLLQTGAQSDYQQLADLAFAVKPVGSCFGQCPERLVGDTDRYFGSSGGAWPPSTDGFAFQVTDFGSMISQSQQSQTLMASIVENPLPTPST